ncbi:MBL fold metallo-hydrolase [Spongisporangium articulatum]|uniref:MBL fold metallo-hydrolase n=1 Tax=Spongisporangium articulatum TaxID=3362603 RepID=A0ABW8ARQ2_9ACTN
MRLRLGRPRIDDYADLFDVPVAAPGAAVRVTFLGVATLLVEAADSSLLTDGFFSRPGLLSVATRPLAPDGTRIGAAFQRAEVGSPAAVVPVHSHFDHALDAPEVARRTGAVLVGGTSTLNIGRGAGLAEEQLLGVADGDTVGLGGFDVRFVASRHCPPDRYPGTVGAPLRPPARASAYRCGEAWSLVVAHRTTGRRLLVQGSAGFVPGALAGERADVVYLGVGQLGVRPEDEIRRYWDETVVAVGARRAVLIHWDDFFRPLEASLRALPYAGDDLDVTVRVLRELAGRDGVRLSLPRVWVREDPWL